ncbi:hypothetical protein Tco_0972135 [Tanacetum coccineum]
MSPNSRLVKALLLDKKHQSQAPLTQIYVRKSSQRGTVVVTCGGAHSYQSCPATDGNVYHDNIQAYVSQAAAANFNQGSTSARPPMDCANQGQNSSSIEDLAFFTSNHKALNVAKYTLSKMNSSTSGSGTLPGNTVTNPKEDLKGITTRSGVAYQGPAIPSTSSSRRVMNRDTETSRALIDVYEGEITLRVGKEAITFNLDQTSRYTANYDHMTANRIDVIELACEEYSQEVLGFLISVHNGNPSPITIQCFKFFANTNSFGDSDFSFLEEANAFIAIDDEPISREIDATYYDPEGDILILEALLNSDPKSSFDEPPEVELKDLPPHLEYAFLEGDDKLPVIIAKDLKDEEKAALIKVLKSHKRAIAWKLSDIKGVDPEFCTHKILMEEDYEPTVQSQRMGNPSRSMTSSKKRLKNSLTPD